MELTDRVIPAHGPCRRGPGRPPEVTDAELVCLAVAQVLLRYHDERHWLRAAPNRVGHLFPAYLARVNTTSGSRTWRPCWRPRFGGWRPRPRGRRSGCGCWTAPRVGCGQSLITARRSDLFADAGYGYEPSHSRYYWGVKLMLLCTAEGTVTGFGLANPKLLGEREAVRQLLAAQPANRPPAGSAIVTDKGLAGADIEAFSPTWSCC